MPGEFTPSDTNEKQPEAAPSDPNARWLQMARDAYDSSTTYVDTNYRKQWENNIRHFQSRHHTDSKYNKADYLYRSKLFRPKTRSAIRNNEAAAVAAFFANKDVVSIEARNKKDKMKAASADINRELLNYRLTDGGIPWFILCIGGFQDAQVNAVCSYQSWEYEEIEEDVEYEWLDQNNKPIMNADGMPKVEKTKERRVVKDQPSIKLIPIENVRLHPNASWDDPVNSSPYLIILWPMFVMDVKLRMTDRKKNPKTGTPRWKTLTDGEISSASKRRFDSTRQTREGQREDKTDAAGAGSLSDFDVVWVHQNFMKIDGMDLVYYTLGTEYMLTDPVPIHEEFFHGERPVVIGTAVIETHKLFASGLGQLGESVQKEINENVNQRMDNVKFVLNKRWFVRRGSQTDVKSITRNVPGGVTLVGDVEKDVKQIDWNDVTSSAYQEQDRLNLDFDEVVGTFSGSTIQSNRRMNETVGGMAMLRGSSNQLTEYAVRTYAETWVEPVLKQLVKLEQYYESDEVVLALAAEKAQLWEQYGINEITDRLLNQDLTVTVNVGMGATDPVLKLQNLTLGVKAVIEVISTVPEDTFLNVAEIVKEIFGFMGYKDGARFVIEEMGDDPEKMQMQQAIQQLTGIIQQLQAQVQDKNLERRTKLELAKIKEVGQDRRKAADIKSQFTQKIMDLRNPVAGEKVNPNAGTRRTLAETA